MRDPSAAGVVTRQQLLVGALLVAVFLATLDQTVVATALPTIVGDLGGLRNLGWVVTGYLLAVTAIAPLFGKLGDLYGRKRLLEAAFCVFLIGSLLCGLSRNLGELVAFRTVQGVGGSGLIVTSLVALADIVPPRERARYQGLFGVVLAVAGVLGPVLGSFFVAELSWRWIFLCNLPLGVVALACVAVLFSDRGGRASHRIDYRGAAALTVSLSALVLVVSSSHVASPWASPQSLVLVVAALASLGAFVAIERHAADPIVPLQLFRNRIFTVSIAIGFVVMFALFAFTTYLPLYLQIVHGESPVRSGLMLAPMMAGMVVTSLASGHLIARSGRYRLYPIPERSSSPSRRQRSRGSSRRPRSSPPPATSSGSVSDSAVSSTSSSWRSRTRLIPSTSAWRRPARVFVAILVERSASHAWAGCSPVPSRTSSRTEEWARPTRAVSTRRTFAHFLDPNISRMSTRLQRRSVLCSSLPPASHSPPSRSAGSCPSLAPVHSERARPSNSRRPPSDEAR
jgi:MFS family permease